MIFSLFIVALLLGSATGINNGVARTPPMGWNPYNVYGCDTNDVQYRAAALALVNSGLRDRGYKFFNLDCGWQGKSRSSSGEFTWDTSKIPDGIPQLSKHVHDLGLSFGIYSDAGYYSCDAVGGAERRLGSLGYELSDAKTFKGWGMDYLKYDNCFAVSQIDFVDFFPVTSEKVNYEYMGDALSQVASGTVFSMCEWGVQDPARWAPSIANSWRISNDIGPPVTFESIKRIINQVVPITWFAGPGAWNDLDLLEVGNNGLTEQEWTTHFAFWACAKSPLMISTDLTQASQEVLNILGNERITAINQDPLGASIAFKRRYTDNYDVWTGPLADGSTVAVLVNWKNNRQSITFQLSDAGISSADITDVWTGTRVATASASHTASVDAHGALVYGLSSIVRAPQRQFKTYLAASPSNILGGGAVARVINATMTVIGNIGYAGTLTFVGVDGGKNGGTKLVSIKYVNADYTFYNSNRCSNCRRVQVSVNGGTPVVAEMPLSGQSWDILSDGYLLSLDGFVPGATNTVNFAYADYWAPDMFSLNIGV